MTASTYNWHPLRVLNIDPGDVLERPADLIADA